MLVNWSVSSALSPAGAEAAPWFSSKRASMELLDGLQHLGLSVGVGARNHVGLRLVGYVEVLGLQRFKRLPPLGLEGLKRGRVVGERLDGGFRFVL